MERLWKNTNEKEEPIKGGSGEHDRLAKGKNGYKGMETMGNEQKKGLIERWGKGRCVDEGYEERRKKKLTREEEKRKEKVDNELIIKEN